MNPTQEAQVERPWRVDDPANPPAVVAYLGRQLAQVKDLQTLDRLAANEVAGRNRKVVLAAVAARRRAVDAEVERHMDQLFDRARRARARLDQAREAMPLGFSR